MKEEFEFWTEQLRREAAKYAADNFCDENAANMAAYDDRMNLIYFMHEIANGGVIMGSAR